jgi:hypothetical protein
MDRKHEPEHGDNQQVRAIRRELKQRDGDGNARAEG